MKNLITQGLTNKKMNSDVYELRSKVMSLIYEAKKVVPDLPRIEVRITESSRELNGKARISKNVIWIPENSAKRDLNALRRTVFHEICHAAFGTQHIKGCPLMDGVYQEITKTKAHKLLKQYAKES